MRENKQVSIEHLDLSAECKMLRDRVAVLEEWLKAAKEERDQANAIAETLYDDYFREHLRIAAARKRRLRD